MKKVIFAFALMATSAIHAQKSVNSPYSYYGLGDRNFSGNAENALMGGISAATDSTRVDVRNPASLGRLGLTTFSVGFTSHFRTISTHSNSERLKTSSIDYISLSFPVYKKIGVSAGLAPYSSTGYKLSSIENNITQTFEGVGGLNKLYLSAGYEIINNLRIGAGISANFGKVELENITKNTNVLYATRENSKSIYRGIDFNLGVQYDTQITEKHQLMTGFAYQPKSNLKATNERSMSLLHYTESGILVKDSQRVDLGNSATTTLIVPSQMTLALGVGEKQKWFAGTDYTMINNNEFHNPFITSDFVTYNQGYKIAVGGFYIPQLNSFTSFWKRTTYRLGFYFEETGIILNNQKIDDMGVTFGASLPIKGFSSLTIGGQWGRRGTKNQNLVKENYFGIKIGLSLNDRWFQKSKYN